MFKCIIVAIDGQEGGRDALALAETLREQDASLTLAYVHPINPYRTEGAVYDTCQYEAPARERARGLLAQVREGAGIDADLRVIGSQSVGRGLHELAEELGADLLVVGSSRRGMLGRVLIGDDTRAALNGAPCAVAIAPAGYAQRPALMREIGVAYNGSPESERALEVARGLAARHGAKLSALEVVSLPSFAYAGGLESAGAAVEDLVHQARARIRALGVEPHAAYGVPSEELALYSASLDLLVVGSRGYGPVSRLVHGSVAHQLARSARCPLLVLTRPARKTGRRTADEAEPVVSQSYQ
jgi:nucleotide-binding universal stress UspA family protein